MKFQTRYQFQYSEYLASNSIINQALMEWTWEGESMKDSGAGGVVVKQHFPEVYQLVEDLVDLDRLSKSKLDELEKLDMILVRNIAGDLWISFSKKKKTKTGSVRLLVSGIDLIMRMSDKGLWFTIQFEGK